MSVQNEPQPEPPLHIEIDRTDKGWSVHCGIRYEYQLAPEEALWCVVRLMTGSGHGYLRTAEQHAEWGAQYGPKKTLELWQKQLAPAEVAAGDPAETRNQHLTQEA